ncbi:hypothetical protein [Parvibaculum sp.]|uniref:hypothetical protein n=1 Tax=Parvibaculum sp. TaxID=2024848 RepID=UPI00273458BE|nr:hypothetical protein [Parvibaculum sp.]MDP3327194.1 hypothetical protein [Parvibaculum sp.]
MSLFTNADVAAFRADRLASIISTYFPSVTWSDAYLLQQIQAAEKDVSRKLKVKLEPTAVFPYPPSDEEIAALDGKPYLDEPGYDYDPEFFRAERWGYIVTRHKPIISVEEVRLAYPSPSQTVYRIPDDWLRLDRKYGQIRMVPASSAFVAPLGAFIMQALGGGHTIPSMIQVKYTVGLENAVTEWPDLIDVIMKSAVLRLIKGGFFPGSESISADGLTQSRTVKIEDFEKPIEEALFGPKGSNGGLWTAIHGIPMGIVGVVV